MKLQRQQVFPQARITDVKFKIGEEEHQITLRLVASLTQEVAENFGIRELIFAGNVPRSGVDRMELEGEEVDPDIHLKHNEYAFQTVCESVNKFVAKFEGTGPLLQFDVKFKGFVITIGELIDTVKVDPLEVTLKPAQLNLGLSGSDQKPEPLPGEEDLSQSCVDCANGVPILEGSFPVTHASGQLCSDPAKQEVKEAPAIASAVEMGGTHQKGNPKKHGRRKPAAEPEEEGDPFADMKVPAEVQ